MELHSKEFFRAISTSGKFLFPDYNNNCACDRIANLASN